VEQSLLERAPMRSLTKKSSRADLLTRALEETVGAAMVLDSALRIVEWTDPAAKVLGPGLRRALRAPRFLCGESEVRPVAEALARGTPIGAYVQRPGPDGSEMTLRVTATPIGGCEAPVGWLLLFDHVDTSEHGREALTDFHGMLTVHREMTQLFERARRAARSEANVLVRGETGSGKELLARAIHEESTRAAGPFRALNCAALPASLLETQLFGHVRGAFTGAVRDEPGHLRLADGGTIFLDEVAELPLELQAKLLRVLEDRKVLPVGGREPVPVDVRVVSATHRSLRREVTEGRFRADLMYRLRVLPLFIPPLRDRVGDIELLARRFLASRAQQEGDRDLELSGAAIRAMKAYAWPGNVRELKNAIEYAAVMTHGRLVAETDLPPEIINEVPTDHDHLNNGAPPDSRPMNQEARRILRALERSAGSRERAAQLLGISRVTLWRKLRALGITDAASSEPEE
jgi:transcriptional regulator with PAS, ATPase and Fis domain